MQQSKPNKIIFTLFTLFVVTNTVFSQSKITEKDLIGNWVITGGSGEEFDKETIGDVFSFKKEHTVSKIEKQSKEVMFADWKIDKDIITFTTYNDDKKKTDPEDEILTVTSFDGKKLVLYYIEDEFTIVFERTKQP